MIVNPKRAAVVRCLFAHGPQTALGIAMTTGVASNVVRSILRTSTVFVVVGELGEGRQRAKLWDVKDRQ